MANADPVIQLDDVRRQRADAAAARGVPEDDDEARAWFNALMQSHGERLAGFFRFKTNDDDVARELVVETFFRAWKSRHTFRGDAKPSTWLWTIGRRALAAYYESKSKRAVEVATDVLPERAPNAPDADERTAKRSALRDCFSALNARIQRTAELVWVLGHSYVEAAELLEESADTVRMRLKRARGPLQRCLAEKGAI